MGCHSGLKTNWSAPSYHSFKTKWTVDFLASHIAFLAISFGNSCGRCFSLDMIFCWVWVSRVVTGLCITLEVLKEQPRRSHRVQPFSPQHPWHVTAGKAGKGSGGHKGETETWELHSVASMLALGKLLGSNFLFLQLKMMIVSNFNKKRLGHLPHPPLCSAI